MLLIQLVLKQRSTVFDRPEGIRQRVDRLRLVVVVVAALTAFSAAVITPTMAVADTATGSASSASVRYIADLSPLANGGVLANTAIGTGGVPTGGGDALVALNNDGDVDWNVPYEDQDQIWQAPVSDAAGNVYYVSYPGDGTTPQLVATRGGTVQWSKPVDAGNSPQPAVGTNGQLYLLDGNSLRGLDAGDGHDLFPALALNEFQSGSYDRLFAYDQGLVIYSGFGKILYVDYGGHVTGGPYTYSVDPDSIIHRDIAASATGDLFITWYDQRLTPDGCLDADSNTHLAKYSPAGLEWTQTLPHVSRCNYGGPYVAATPNGGAVVSGSSALGATAVQFGATIQYTDASGETTWRRDITRPVADSTLRTTLRAHVDQYGTIFATTNFAFGCNRNDPCWGVQVFRFEPDGAESNPILLKGDPLNQESWFTSWTERNLALTPGHVVMSLKHDDMSSPAVTTRHSVDAFPVSGVGFEYPQSALWEMMRGSTTPAPTTEPTPTPTSPAKLSIVAHITDYEPWLDQTTTQPFVTLKFYVSGPDGLPAEGAKVRVSNSPKATFTVPASGWLRLVQDVSKGEETVSITVTKGDLTGSKEVKVFSEERTIRCETPGEPSRLKALSYYMEFVIPHARSLGTTMETFYELLGGVNKVTGNLPEDLETVAWGTEYTGTFKTIYGIDLRVEEVKTGDSYKEFDAVFSRKSELLDSLFKGDGTPLQQIGRSLTCTGPVA